jgi:flagellar hook assembly protein FlgD
VVEDKNKTKNFIYELNQNYPNPFNPSTKINYQVASTGFVSLKVFDIIGNEIALLVRDVKKPGKYEVIWDGRNYNGKDVSSGIYLYKLEAGNYSVTKKMVLIR